jgi:hypothetical protein
MKKTIQSVMMAALAISLLATSCTKDAETKTTDSTPPTISFRDSLGATTYDTANFFVSPIIIAKAAPSAGTTIDSVKVDIKIGGTTEPGVFEAADAGEKQGFVNVFGLRDILKGAILVTGTTVSFTATVKDSKGKTATATIAYTIVKDNGVLVSKEIELGAQSNTSIPYKFLGLVNNFETYTAGSAGTAKNNSDKIDFVYYFGQNDKNAIGAPNNADGAKAIWATEINMWPKQNATKFRTSTLSSTDFDNIKNGTKVEDAFVNIDFTGSEATEKITNLSVGQVYAFQTARGVKGIIKFTAIAADNTGSTKVVVICQN